MLIRYPVREANERDTFADYREKLVESLFSAMLGQRMQELAQQASPPFMGGSSAMGRLTARYESFNAYAALGKGGAAPAIAALVQENERARQFGFSAAELERAKKNMMRNFERAYSERDKTDSGAYVGEYVRNFLEQESIPGIENEYNYARELVPGISLDELNRFARKHHPGRHRQAGGVHGLEQGRHAGADQRAAAGVGRRRRQGRKSRARRKAARGRPDGQAAGCRQHRRGIAKTRRWD